MAKGEITLVERGYLERKRLDHGRCSCEYWLWSVARWSWSVDGESRNGEGSCVDWLCNDGRCGFCDRSSFDDGRRCDNRSFDDWFDFGCLSDRS